MLAVGVVRLLCKCITLYLLKLEDKHSVDFEVDIIEEKPVKIVLEAYKEWRKIVSWKTNQNPKVIPK